MSPTEIRIAVAEACGWTNVACDQLGNLFGNAPSNSDYTSIPDYPGDLNAAKDAAVKLCDTYEKKGVFGTCLYHMRGAKEGCCVESEFANNTASALDICTALLKALGLWKEGEE